MERLLEILSEIKEDVDFSTCTTLIDDGILDSFDMVHRLPTRGTCICTRNSAIQPCPLLVLYNKFGINASVILYFGHSGHLGHQSSCRRWTIL